MALAQREQIKIITAQNYSVRSFLRLNMKENILVSACLLGEKCRYDGKGKLSSAVLALTEKYNLIPVCPEVLGGLPIPRIPCEISEERVISANGDDFTEEYKKGAAFALEIAKKNNCTLAVLKSLSPSCGKGEIYDGSFTGKKVKGFGITASVLQKNKIKVISDTKIKP